MINNLYRLRDNIINELITQLGYINQFNIIIHSNYNTLKKHDLRYVYSYLITLTCSNKY